MSSIMPAPKLQFDGIAGLPLVGGKLYTFAAGTSTPKSTYSDAANTVAQPNPITLNSRGEPTNAVFWSGNYRVELRDALGNLIYTVDNYQSPLMPNDLSASGGAGLTGFDYASGYAPGTIGKWLQNLATSTGATFIGFLQAGAGAVVRTLQSKLREWVHVTDLGCVNDGDAATFAGTDNSAALQAMLNNAVLAGVIAQGGATRIFPTGVFCFDTPLVVDSSGVSFLRLIGNGNGTRLIYRGAAGTGLSFTASAYDGTYGKLNSRITIENLMVFCQPAQVAAGNTRGISFINCAEVKLVAVSSHYAHEAFYFKDTPNVVTDRCEAINSYIGLSHKKTTTFADSDLASVVHNNAICSGNTIDAKIDGARDIKFNDCLLASTQAANIRASGAGSGGDQVELVSFNQCFFDYQDNTTTTVQIGDPTDVNFQIKQVSFNDCYWATSPSFTKSMIRVDSPLAISVIVNGGYCSEVVNKFLTIGSSCLSTLETDINNIGANSCLTYRITDERSATQRTELFEHYPALQLNPDFYYFPTGGYYPFGFGQTQAANIARSTAAFVTGDCALILSGAGNPAPAAACVWYPQFGDVTVDQGSDLVIEWIVKTPSTAAKNTLVISTTNIDGSGAAATVADPLLTSLVQSYSNGFSRLIHAFKVPNNKVVTSIMVQGAIGETINVDYFQVYGPNKYRPLEMLYPGLAADFATAGFTVAKFRSQKAMKRTAGQADEIYACRKDAAGTYSWQLVV